MHRISTKSVQIILMVAAIIFILEMIFTGASLLFSALFLGFLTYLGWRYFDHIGGKVMFWFGLLSLLLNVLNLVSVQFLIIATLFIFLMSLRKSSRETEHISLDQPGEPSYGTSPGWLKSEPLLPNRWIGDVKTPGEPYLWRDVNIHGGVGDRVIDLSNAVWSDEAVVSVRHMVGHISVYVPYEVEVSVSHSTLFGRLTLFQEERGLKNESVHYRTTNYDTSDLRVRIIISVISGDVEVKRR